MSEISANGIAPLPAPAYLHPTDHSEDGAVSLLDNASLGSHDQTPLVSDEVGTERPNTQSDVGQPKKTLNLLAPLPPLPTEIHGRHRRKYVSPLNRNPYVDTSSHRLPSKTSSGKKSSQIVPKTPTHAQFPFDLRPPPPVLPERAFERRESSIFSHDHLATILETHELLVHFAHFVASFDDGASSKLLIRYLQTQKAIKAVNYANAVADAIERIPGDRTASIPCSAAQLDLRFEQRAKRAFNSLLTDVLPAYITWKALREVSHLVHNSIRSGSHQQIRKSLDGLLEAFCISDPYEQDNPIIYASEGFCTLALRDILNVIGHNCRFLQGPKTHNATVARIKRAIAEKESICETILNFRSDGSSFANLLTISPLLDDKGRLKYLLGSQIDVSSLLECNVTRSSEDSAVSSRGKEANEALKDLHHLYGISEGVGNIVTGGVLENSVFIEDNRQVAMEKFQEFSKALKMDNAATQICLHTKAEAPSTSILLPDTTNDANSITVSKKSSSSVEPLYNQIPRFGPYKDFLIIRSHPSLRIVFVSPAMRSSAKELLQTRLFTHISGPTNSILQLRKKLAAGESTVAKVYFALSHISQDVEDETQEEGEHKKRYLHTVPLIGGDKNIGVWLIILFDANTPELAPSPIPSDDDSYNSKDFSLIQTSVRRNPASNTASKRCESREGNRGSWNRFPKKQMLPTLPPSQLHQQNTNITSRDAILKDITTPKDPIYERPASAQEISEMHAFDRAPKHLQLASTRIISRKRRSVSNQFPGDIMVGARMVDV